MEITEQATQHTTRIHSHIGWDGQTEFARALISCSGCLVAVTEDRNIDREHTQSDDPWLAQAELVGHRKFMEKHKNAHGA